MKRFVKRRIKALRRTLQEQRGKALARSLLNKHRKYLPPRRAKWKVQRVGQFEFMPSIDRWSDENRLFSDGPRLYRYVPDNPRDPRWRLTRDLLKSRTMESLFDRGLVPRHTPTDLALPGFPDGQVYEVERIEAFNYCFEHNTAQLIDAAVCCCDISLFLLEEQSDVRLTDTDLINVSFQFTKPMFIDIGSFTDRPGGLPLFEGIKLALQREQKVDPAAARTVFEGIGDPVSVEAITEVKHRLLTLSIEGKSTEWDSYVDLCIDEQRTLPKSIQEIRPRNDEQKRLCAWVSRCGADVASVIDVGGNDGEFARLFAKEGKKVVSLDVSNRASATGYRNAKELELPILFLTFSVIDRYSLSAPYWRYQEKVLIRRYPALDWRERLASDLAFCSSVTHHLFRHGLCFQAQAQLWNKIARRYLIVEFVSPDDIHLRKWNLPSSYSRETFLDSLSPQWKTVESFDVGTRIWYLFKRA